MAALTRNPGMASFQGIKLAVVEGSGWTKDGLTMALIASRRMAARVDVFMTIDALFSKAEKCVEAGVRRELRQGKRLSSALLVTVAAKKLRVSPDETEGDVGMLEVLLVLSLPGYRAHQPKALSVVLLMAVAALDLLS
jgi:hypothetical protein